MSKVLSRLSALVMLLFVAFAVAGCVSGNNEAGTFKASNSYIVVDINPSIEIVTDDEGLVVQVTALNEDAKVLLVDVDLTGKTVDEAVAQLMELAKELGYIGLEDENAIAISVEAEDDRTAEDIIAHLQEKVNQFKDKHQLRVNCIIDQLTKDPSLIEEAQTLDISVNKLALIKTAMEYDTTLTVEAGKDMSVKALLGIILEARKAAEGIEDEEDLKDFFENHKRLGAEILVKHIELVNAALQNATDEALAEVLAGASTTAQAVKDLYQEYLTKVQEAVANYENGTTTPDDGTTTPDDGTTTPDETVDIEVLKGIIDDLRAQLETLNTQREQLFANFAALDETAPEYEAQKAQFKADLEALRTNTETVVVNLAKALQDLNLALYNREHEDEDFGFGGRHARMGFGFMFGFGFGHEFNEAYERDTDLIDTINALTAEYEAKFEELGVNMHDVENLFLETITADFEAFKETCAQNFDQFKEQLRERTEEVRDSYRQQKDSLKKLYH